MPGDSLVAQMVKTLYCLFFIVSEEIEWEVGVSRCKLLCIEWINKVLLCSTGNYIQYLMINHNAKAYFKKKRVSKSSMSNINDHWSQTTNRIKYCETYQNVTQKHWSKQMLLEKWHQQTCLTESCHKPSICLKKCSICKVQ